MAPMKAPLAPARTIHEAQFPSQFLAHALRPQAPEAAQSLSVCVCIGKIVKRPVGSLDDVSFIKRRALARSPAPRS